MNGIFQTVEVGRRSQKVLLEYQERQQARGLIPFFFFLYAEAGDCLGSLSVTGSLPVTKMAEVYP